MTPKRNARRTAPTVPIRARSTPTSTSNVRENFFRIHASISRSTGRTAAVPLERRARIPAATSENRVATDGDVPYVRPSSTAVMMNVVAITSKTPEHHATASGPSGIVNMRRPASTPQSRSTVHPETNLAVR